MNVPEENPHGDSVLLKVVDVSKCFGGVKALSNVSFDLTEGLIRGMIGPNGAGKTTLFNIITGHYVPDAGKIYFKGREIQGQKVHHLVETGIARTFQNVELFSSMSVLENVMVGQFVRTTCGFLGAIFRGPSAKREEEHAKMQAMEILSFLGIDHLANHRSGDLPFGWQRLLEIARALASSPKLLLLDEPAAGLNATETRQLGELLMKIRQKGVTLLLVEHDMSLTMEISDRIVVLDQGKLLAEGTPREVQSDKAVMAAYLGQ
jgi:branched-chain amino acid transport system ATP-binding protein